MSGVNRKNLPFQTQFGDTVRRKRMNRILDENPCIASPAAPTNLVLTFDTVERQKHDRIRAKCSFDSVQTDEDGFDLQVKIDRYVIEFQQAKTDEHDNDDWTDEPRHKVVNAIDPDWKPVTFTLATNRVVKNKHGFRNGDRVKFGGKQLPAPLVVGNPYWVVQMTEDYFQVSLTQGGAAIDFTGSGGDPGGEVGYFVPKRYNVWFRGHIMKRRWYRFRVRAISKGKAHPTARSDWTAWEPLHGAQPIDNTPPPTPLLVTIHENAKDRVVVQWDDPVDADDPDIVDEDIAFYQVQLSKFANFSTIYRFDRFQVVSHRSFKVKTVDKGDTFYARVRSVDSSRNKSAWIPATLAGNSDPGATPDGSDEKQAPVGQAPNAPGNPSGAFDAQGTRHARYRVLVTTGTSTTDATHDAPHRYVVQLAHSATGPSSAPPAGTKRINQSVEGDATGDDLTVTFKGIPRNHYVWIRGRARNPGGASAWSPAGTWVSLGLASASGATSTPSAPGTPSLVAGTPPRRLVWEWAEPSDEETTRWQVTVKRAGVTVSGYPKNTRENRWVYRVPKADVGVNHTVEVQAINDLGVLSGTGTSGTASAADDTVHGDQIIDGTIGDLTPFASNIRPVSIGSGLPSLPSSLYPNGAMHYATAGPDGPGLYENRMGSWVFVNNSTFMAGKIVAGQIEVGAVSASEISVSNLSSISANMGTITAGSIYSAYIATDTSGSYIVMDGVGSSKDRLQFWSGGNSAAIVASGGGMQIGAGTGANIGFWGNAVGSKPTAVTGSRGGIAALGQLLTKLHNMGLITDSSTT